MRYSVHIPQAGQAMTEGTIAEWFVSDGAAVATGQPLYLLETDKVEMEIDAPASGVVTLHARAGEVHPVGAVVASIDALEDASS